MLSSLFSVSWSWTKHPRRRCDVNEEFIGTKKTDQTESSCASYCERTECYQGFTFAFWGDCQLYRTCPAQIKQLALVSYNKPDAVTTKECDETTLATEGATEGPGGTTLATERTTEGSGETTLAAEETTEGSGGAIQTADEITEGSRGTTLAAVETTESSEGTTLTEGNGWVGRKVKLIFSSEILVIKWLTLLIQASLVTCCYTCLFYKYYCIS